mgnify:FL=1
MNKAKAYKDGQDAARNGYTKVSGLNGLEPCWGEWMRGYEEATKNNENPVLTPRFRLRNGVTQHNKRPAVKP